MLSFTDVLAEHTTGLLRFATVVTADPHLAEDVVQDVLVKAYRRWDAIAGLEHPIAYLRRMVVNEHVSWRRKWSRLVPRATVELPAPTSTGGDHADAIALHEELLGGLRSLPPKQRAAVVLRYYADQPDDEIAEALGCSASTVRSQIARALAKLRVELTDEPRPTMTVSTTEGSDCAHDS